MTDAITIIDSYDRQGGITSPSTYFRISLNAIKDNVKAISCILASIPNTAYNVYNYSISNAGSYSNNNIPFGELASTVVATVPVGNYNITTLCAAIGVAMTSASPTLQTYTATYDATSMKITVTTTGPNQFKFLWNSTIGGIDYTDINLSYVMGWNNVNTAFSLALSLVGNNAVNLGGPSTYLIKCANFQNHVFNTEGDSGLFIIPNNVNASNVCYYEPTYNVLNRIEFTRNANVTVTYLDIALVDNFLRIIDLNGSDWSFALKVEYYN